MSFKYPWNHALTWAFHSAVVLLIMGVLYATISEIRLTGLQLGYIVGVWGYIWREMNGWLSGKFTLDSIMDVLVPLVLGGILVLVKS
jgi:hypothetical protein